METLTFSPGVVLDPKVGKGFFLLLEFINENSLPCVKSQLGSFYSLKSEKKWKDLIYQTIICKEVLLAAPGILAFIIIII